MNITVDCRCIDSSGIGVYLRGCLPCFLASDNHFFLVGDAGKLEPIISGRKNAGLIDCSSKPFSFGELFFFPANCLSKINKTDVYYSPFINIPRGIKVPVFTTIHDIIFPDMPHLISRAGLAARMWFFRRAYKKSKKIFTVSAFSKSRIEHHLGTARPVIVTHSAVHPDFSAYINGRESIQKKQTIVFIGNIKKHKGLDTLLDAFLLAKNDGLPHKLLIIGSKENFRTTDNDITRKIASVDPDAVSFSGFISGGQLMECLAQASLLVQPSLYEGFGLPPLEAMVLGTPALITDIPVFREIYEGYPVTFFKAGDVENLKMKLMKLLFNKEAPELRLPEVLSSRYTFEKTASIILQELLP